MKKIVFTGGGTLGHVMPNIVLMNEFDKKDIAYIGGAGIEKERLKGVVDFYEIPCVKLVRGKFFTNFKIPFVLFDSIIKAKKILKKIQPEMVFSKGGYVSLPVCIAAKILRIPIVAHESDFTFGLSNKIILRLCNTMCVNFKNLASMNDKVVYTGPIFEKEFDNKIVKKNSFVLDKNKKTILIVGGSLGSKKINELVLKNLEVLTKDFNLIHVMGKGNLKVKSYGYYNAVESYNDMNTLYNLADLVIGRSGAGVTSECFYKELPMILIPLENGSSRGDQTQNAEYYSNIKVAKILHEKDLNDNVFLSTISSFVKDLNWYKNNYKTIYKINGREKILNIINKYIAKNNNKNKEK